MRILDYNEDYVLATGGGAPCFLDTMELMKKYGTTIFLDVGFDDLFNKLSKKTNQNRPLLNNLSLDELYLELKNKLKERKKIYQQSVICLKQNLNDLDFRVKQVVEAIKLLEE